MENKWWGYLHVNGTIQVKRLFDFRDLEEAAGSTFCYYVFSPFEAKNRDDALNKLEELIKERNLKEDETV